MHLEVLSHQHLLLLLGLVDPRAVPDVNVIPSHPNDPLSTDVDLFQRIRVNFNILKAVVDKESLTVLSLSYEEVFAANYV
jgi:hypothetical protein